jgi:hypothetical protein
MGRQAEAPKPRAYEMANRFAAGQTLQQIGDLFGLSRERVRQIIKPLGMNRARGGQRVVSNLRLFSIAERRIASRQKRIQKQEEYFGCSYSEIMNLSGGVAPFMARKKTPFSPVSRFLEQKINATKRGIGWELSLPEWWRIWQDSGKWELRGRGAGYCMGRFGDSGPYSVDNVYICTIGQNFSDSHIVRPRSSYFNRPSTLDERGLNEIERAICAARESGKTRKQISHAVGKSVGYVNWEINKLIRRGIFERKSA